MLLCITNDSLYEIFLEVYLNFAQIDFDDFPKINSTEAGHFPAMSCRRNFERCHRRLAADRLQVPQPGRGWQGGRSLSGWVSWYMADVSRR